MTRNFNHLSMRVAGVAFAAFAKHSGGPWRQSSLPAKHAVSMSSGIAFSEVQTTRGPDRNDYVNRAVQRLVGSMDAVEEEVIATRPVFRADILTVFGSLFVAFVLAFFPSGWCHKLAHWSMPFWTAVIAAVGTYQEYKGHSNRANSHEISALAVSAAAEADAILCQAERTKAVLPVCVVWSASIAAFSVTSSQAIEVFFEEVLPKAGLTFAASTANADTYRQTFASAGANGAGFDNAFHQTFASNAASSFAVDSATMVDQSREFFDQASSHHHHLFDGPSSLFAADLDSLADLDEAISNNVVEGTLSENIRTAYLLACPVATVLLSLIASLASREVSNLCVKAQSLGRRRFATRRDVGRTWRSSPQLVLSAADNQKDNWLGFGAGLVPGPLVATLAGNVGVATKAVLASAAAAAQTAWYLSVAEYSLARCQESVASKMRTASVAEAWAKQTQRANGRVPACSAVGAFAVGGCALAVEVLPVWTTFAFPCLAAFYVIRAANFRAQTKVEADAASAAADQLAGLDDGSDDDPLLPLVLTWRNLLSALGATRDEFKRIRRLNSLRVKAAIKAVFNIDSDTSLAATPASA